MFGEERKAQIINLLKLQGDVKVSNLADTYKVSEVTIRKDLQELEEEGLIKRVHGGAVLVHNTKFEPTFYEKVDKFIEEKIAIGKQAASMVEDGDTVALDGGTTNLQIARNIRANNLTVITNSLDIAIELSNNHSNEVIVIGGTLRSHTRALIGPIASSILKNVRVDIAFVGANGISLDYGITTPNMNEAQTKREIIESAERVIIVCDHSKFSEVCFAKITDFDKIHYIVTDSKLDEGVRKEFREKGIRIITAKEGI
ncbi:DeoR/GlpR transcriptional regulator [Clostridium sp. 19966]|uniref:DeoR/GlpR family DNA-binding transcription regulator n=1 Tax=Clostridium sp. 19966 TaxID=2768166 RepID=UPI0028DE01AE|nr:DeoR/GlpR family DNA-binding transcription regulator [Clostridium sp. 19966]MDT8718586.1 DeoR/GlpR transcriptional regulator [Clostridium sp. 19966]